MVGLLMLFNCLIQICSGQDYKVTSINSSSGLYYEKIGQVLLSNNNWEFVTSIDYKGYLLFFQYLQEQAAKLEEFCTVHKSDYCKERLTNIRTALGRLEETDENLTGFLGIKRTSTRIRRFWSAIGNFFLGQGILSLFGGSSNRDMSVYNEQISSLRMGQAELMNRINLQTTAFVADAEKKNIQIEWLQKTQNDIQSKVASLESTVMKDSEEKTKRIDELNSMMNETRKRLEKQEELQKKMSKNIETIEKKLTEVDQKLLNLGEVISKQGQALNETNLKVELNSLTIDFNFLLDQFESEQGKLFYVIRRAKKGELDPYVLTPLNLIEMMQNIMPNMQEVEKFPFFPNIENARDLYNLITPEVYFYNYTLFFILKMPLVHLKSFEFFKLTSLPIPAAKNTFAFILPKDPFLVIDKIYKEYLTMPFQEYIDFCKQIAKNLFLCKQTQPLSSVYSQSICEVALLTTRSIPNTCDKRILYLDDILFLQLQKPKSWIYLAPAIDTPVFVNCDLQRHVVLIEGSGFITLSNNCKLRYKEFGIESLIEYTKPVESNYTSAVNLTESIKLSDIKEFQPQNTEKHTNLILPFNLKELSDISVAVEKTNSNLGYLYFLLLLPVAVTISVLIYMNKIKMQFAVKWCLKNKNSTNDERTAMATSNSTNEEEKLRIRLKLNNKKERVTAMSICAVPSENDADSEYLTVRVKVKKNEEHKNQATDRNNFVSEVHEDDIYDNSALILEHNYLNDLRKLKPTK